MTNNALIYRRPSKWAIATALAAAVIIHLSAVPITFYQEPSATQPAAIDSKPSGLILPTIRRLVLQIAIFLSRCPYRFRQPILLNLRKLVA